MEEIEIDLASKITTATLPSARRETIAMVWIGRALMVLTAVSPFLGIWVDWKWFLTFLLLLPLTAFELFISRSMSNVYRMAEERLNSDEDPFDSFYNR